MLIFPDTHIFMPIAKRSSPTSSRAGHLVKGITSGIGAGKYRRREFSKRLALGKENFCFDDELLRLWVDRSRAIEFREVLLSIVFNNYIVYFYAVIQYRCKHGSKVSQDVMRYFL